MSIIVELVKEYENHISGIFKKHQKIVKEHRDYIYSMRDDLVLIWGMVSDEKSHEEIKQRIQQILHERFGFYPKKANCPKKDFKQ